MIKNYRNNNTNRRRTFRSPDRNFRQNGSNGFNGNSENGSNGRFFRNGPSRGNLNATKLLEKYNNLATEALNNGDKVLSETYYQHADHFTRIQNEQESNRIARMNSSSTENKTPSTTKTEIEETVKTKEVKEITSKPEIKNTEKKTAEKKSVAG